MRVARTSNALRNTFYTFQIFISYYAFLISVSNMFTFYLPPVCIRIERLTIEFLKCVRLPPRAVQRKALFAWHNCDGMNLIT
jgi:hypothetical protein